MANDKLALYFGYGDGGHFLRGLPGHVGRYSIIRPERDVPSFPWAIGQLDTGLLMDSNVVDHPDGSVFWTTGTGLGTPDGQLWFAFYWWDRSGDTRPGSNSGFYVRWPEAVSVDDMFGTATKAFAFACEMWPNVVSRQKQPLVLQMFLKHKTGK